jgi:hypothetical protein
MQNQQQQEGNELPPKTCTIERLITIQSDIDLVLAGTSNSP